MSDPPPPSTEGASSSSITAPSIDAVHATPTTTTATNSTEPIPTLQPTLPQVRYPPFPPKPEGVRILPFSEFHEHGIQIFTDPETGVEIDGLGIPTVRLRVPHDTDARKTRAPPGGKVLPGGDEDDDEGDGEDEDEDGDGAETGNGNGSKGKKKKKKKRAGGGGGGESEVNGAGEKGKGKETIDYRTIKDPIKRAQEQRRQRLLVFAKKEWWDQWAEGEDLRKGRIYDTNLSTTDRIHMAATEFRVGRMWPPSSSRLRFLWDQFRLFVGLLGSTPVWIRTDLPQHDSDSNPDDDDDSDADASSDFDAPAAPSPAVQGYTGQDPREREKPASGPSQTERQRQKRKATVESDSEDEFAQARYSDEEEAEGEVDEEGKDDEEESQNNAATNKPPPEKRKRIPPRPPYALYNLAPIPISSPAHVPILLSLAQAQRHSKLLTFLASPSRATRVFLSSYIHQQGLIYSPLYLTSLPRLVLFFLEFLIRVRALPELGRELRAACQVARKAVEEVPRTGWVCRNFPDAMGRGCRGIWGTRWVQEGWVWGEGQGEGVGTGSDTQNGGAEVGASATADEPNREETEEEAMRRFEDELRAANVQLMPADPADLGMPPENDNESEDSSEGSSTSLSNIEEEDEDEEEEENVVGLEDIPANIRIEIMSPTSPGYVEPESAPVGDSQAFIEEVNVDEEEVQIQVAGEENGGHEQKQIATSEEEAKGANETRQSASSAHSPPEPSPTTVETPLDQPNHTQDIANTTTTPETQPPPQPPTTSSPTHPPSALPTDWSSPSGPTPPSAAQQAAARAAWSHPPDQPLLPILGPMSVFPLAFEPGGRSARVGVAERSMRRVKEVLRAGEREGRVVAGEERAREGERERMRMRGVEEDLVDKFARVMLEPWMDWEDGGVGGEYVRPKVQGPGPLPSFPEDEGHDAQTRAQELSEITRRRAKYAHDAVRDDITLLVEPRVAENIGVGMGLAGTWVQLVPIVNPFDIWEPGTRGGGARGRGRGKGGGGGERGGRGGGGRGGRGRGRGRGGAPPPPTQTQELSEDQNQDQENTPTQPHPQKPQAQPQHRSPTFWYVEEIHMAVPSFWTIGEPEEDLAQALEDALAERGEGGGREGGLEGGLEGSGEVAMVMEGD